MFLRQNTSGSLPGQMNAGAVDDRIGSGKIDVFKDTQLFLCFSAMRAIGANAVRADRDDFTGQNIPHEGSTDRIQRTGFRGKNDSAVG